MTAVPETRQRYLIGFDDPACRDPELVGSKAASLAGLAATGFDVPEAFVLTTYAFEDAVADVDRLSPTALETLPLPSPVEQALLRARRRLDGAVLAVRSSGVSEDLAGSSFAGQYETVLGVRSPEELGDAVRRCWASALSDRVTAYRREHDVDAPIAMAVLIQRQVEAEAAGVAFTADPVSGDRGVTVVNAVLGLADRLVSGEVTPEEWRVHTDGSERTYATEPVLQRGQAEAVATTAREIAARAGTPQDVEWALEDGRLWVLQSRPITGLPERSVAPVPVPVEPPPGFWERDVSHWPDPGSPLQTSLVYPIVDRYSPEFLDAFGMLAERIQMRDIGGWHYLRVVPFGGKERKPPPLWLARILARVHPGMRRRIRTAIEAKRAGRAETFIDRWYEQWMPGLARRIDELRAVDLEAASDDELARHLEGVVDLKTEGLRIHMLVIGTQTVGIYGLVKACRDLLGWDETRAFEMLRGLSRRSTEPSRRLAELAAMAAARPAVRDLLDDITGRTPERIAAVDDEFAAAFEEYRHRYGISVLARDPIEPTLEERPELLLQLLANQLATGFDPGATDAENERSRSAAVAEARSLLDGDPAARARFDAALDLAERAYPIREDNIFFTLFSPDGLLRRAALEAGRRMAVRGHVEAPDDVFFLTWEELRESFTDRTDRRALVKRRRGERAWTLAHPGPVSYGPKPGDPPSLDFLPEEARYAMESLLWLLEVNDMGRPEGNTATRLRGIPASAGTYTGTVRVITSEAEFDKLEAGDVLVCPITSPSWSVLFPSVGALVTDSGGILNHPAIIAREYRIPAVVASGNATELLRDGQTVTVDGTAGTVALAN